ncbi:hypothetical protein BJX66DRAFT_330034 [Aspergillus keveii]|uniref:NB-ARC domain-containing protein n=1 Tax=Aspergillus keveii TaxID=714993 RepID=A0ABR4FM61_9EURO
MTPGLLQSNRHPLLHARSVTSPGTTFGKSQSSSIHSNLINNTKLIDSPSLCERWIHFPSLWGRLRLQKSAIALWSCAGVTCPRTSSAYVASSPIRSKLWSFGLPYCWWEESQSKFDGMAEKVGSLGQSLHRRISDMEDLIRTSNGKDREVDEQNSAALFSLQRSLTSVATAGSVIPANIFFDIPQPVNSLYTGRQQFLNSLRDISLKPKDGDPIHKQQRFVICGISGSGKTQFCCKFADRNREVGFPFNFWGIFYVDASTHERAKQTYVDIAKLGNVEPNQKAAMHWLSNRPERWLLLIDNADDPGVNFEDYFPKGDGGLVIVTTRNPDHKVYGNLGPGYFEFQGMEEEDSSALLLRSAHVKEPWDVDSESRASKIARRLGFLALALIHAGATIRENICSLKNYLAVYDKSWQRIRWVPGDEDEEILRAVATYEVCFAGIEERATRASEDAIQLLKMFSFFYSTNIRFDILKRAVLNAVVEREAERRQTHVGSQRTSTWHEWYRDARLFLLAFIVQNRGPPALPSCLRDGLDAEFNEPRVRYALRELTQMSLVTHDKSNDTYSMHPTAEQAVWAHIAPVVLSRSILLPPHDESHYEELFRRDILPHIDHVRSCQESINRTIIANRERRWYGLVQWHGAQSRLDRDQAMRFAKFSFIFAHNGRWKDAEELQLAVKAYTDRVLGPDHRSSRRITLALAQTYWNQGRGDEAAELQDTVLQACIKWLGPDEYETLMAEELLGETRWQQGRCSDARVLQQHAVNGLTKLKGSGGEDTLTATGRLGRTEAKFYENLDEAKKHITEAFRGLSSLLGPKHTKTLSVQEDLALLALQMKEDLSDPLEWLQHHDEAEDLVRRGLSIAERNLGIGHIGYLMGKTLLGTILTNQSKYAEAESTLLEVLEKQRHLSACRGDFHPDRLGAMIELVSCYRVQGKLDESIQYCDEVIKGLQRISATQHPLERKMRAQKQDLMGMRLLRGD